jgi:hypothetical protein
MVRSKSMESFGRVEGLESNVACLLMMNSYCSQDQATGMQSIQILPIIGIDIDFTDKQCVYRYKV